MEHHDRGLEPAEYISTAEAARLAGESPRTWEGRRLKGNGPDFYRVGRGKRPRIRYRRDEVIAWINAGRIGGAS